MACTCACTCTDVAQMRPHHAHHVGHAHIMHHDPYPHRCAGAAAPGRARADGLRLQAHGDRLLLHPPTGAAARRGGESRSSDRAAAWRVSVYGAPGVMTRHSSSRGKPCTRLHKFACIFCTLPLRNARVLLAAFFALASSFAFAFAGKSLANAKVCAGTGLVGCARRGVRSVRRVTRTALHARL